MASSGTLLFRGTIEIKLTFFTVNLQVQDYKQPEIPNLCLQYKRREPTTGYITQISDYYHAEMKSGRIFISDPSVL